MITYEMVGTTKIATITGDLYRLIVFADGTIQSLLEGGGTTQTAVEINGVIDKYVYEGTMEELEAIIAANGYIWVEWK